MSNIILKEIGSEDEDKESKIVFLKAITWLFIRESLRPKTPVKVYLSQ